MNQRNPEIKENAGKRVTKIAQVLLGPTLALTALLNSGASVDAASLRPSPIETVRTSTYETEVSDAERQSLANSIDFLRSQYHIKDGEAAASFLANLTSLPPEDFRRYVKSRLKVPAGEASYYTQVDSMSEHLVRFPNGENNQTPAISILIKHQYQVDGLWASPGGDNPIIRFYVDSNGEMKTNIPTLPSRGSQFALSDFTRTNLTRAQMETIARERFGINPESPLYTSESRADGDNRFDRNDPLFYFSSIVSGGNGVTRNLFRDGRVVLELDPSKKR